MTTLGRRGQLTFDPDALAEVFMETSGHPSLTRALGSQIREDWDSKGEVGRGSFFEGPGPDRYPPGHLRDTYGCGRTGDGPNPGVARTATQEGPLPPTSQRRKAPPGP